jgi:hypothetical protein
VPPLWGRLEPEFGVPAQDEKVTGDTMKVRKRGVKRTAPNFTYQQLTYFPALSYGLLSTGFLVYDPFSKVRSM